jgi:UDP:flavonoid glycosyltransferase YjiC (YdhE family)
MSQAMAAGIPQIIMPMAFDQVDNAYRVEKLGIGCSIPVKKFQIEPLVTAIQALLTSSTVTQHCSMIANRLSTENGLQSACDEILQRPISG